MSNQNSTSDFDWLYRRENQSEPTAVLPTAPIPVAPTQNLNVPASGYPQPQIPYPPANELPSIKTIRVKKRRRHPFRRTITLLVLAWLTFMVATPWYAWTKSSTVDATPVGTRPPNQPGSLTLLVGSDSRSGLSTQQRGELGTGSTQGKRTDTMLLLYTPPKGKPALISLPRDSYLPIPGYGNQKLNSAYSLGGAKLLVQTIEQNTGLRIDGYLEIGFLGIVDSVNALGGIEICLPSPIKDKDSHLDLAAGCQTLNGKNALGYVRMRKQDLTGDLGRMKRQRQMIGLIVKKILAPGVLLNPVTYWQLNFAAAKTIVHGKDTGFHDLWATALSFHSLSANQGYTFMVPIAKANAITRAGSAVLWDKPLAKKLFDTIAAGSAEGLSQFSK